MLLIESKLATYKEKHARYGLQADKSWAFEAELKLLRALKSNWESEDTNKPVPTSALSRLKYYLISVGKSLRGNSAGLLRQAHKLKMAVYYKVGTAFPEEWEVE